MKKVTVELEFYNNWNEVIQSDLIAEFINLGWAKDFIRGLCVSELFFDNTKYKLTVNNKVIYLTKGDTYEDFINKMERNQNMKKISISEDTKNEYDVEWFKKNVKNIDIKDILDYSRNNCWIDTKKEYEVIYEDNEYHFIRNGINVFLIKREEDKFKKGDKVEIVDKDYTCMLYDDWFKEYNIDATYWCYNTEPNVNETYTIVEIRKHLEFKDWIICLIKDRYGRMFLIRDKGIKRV